METTGPEFEVIITIDGEGDASERVDRVRSLVDTTSADASIEVDHYPEAMRGVVTRAFFTSVGIATITKSSLGRIADVLGEVAAALDGTADAEAVTVQIGEEVIPLADVTREMIESWLPARV